MISADELMTKARRALASARLLLTAEDADGACNRAYYAMFDASRAALMAVGFAELAITTKIHSGLISVFSLHLVKTEKLPTELGRSLNNVEDIRLMADYLGKGVDIDKADWSLQQAALFVETIDKEERALTPMPDPNAIKLTKSRLLCGLAVTKEPQHC